VLSANSGRKSPEAEAQCKVIFEQLDTRGEYTRYEENAYKRIGEMINAVDEQHWGQVCSGHCLGCRYRLFTLVSGHYET
jgi:hypothetical protein